MPTMINFLQMSVTMHVKGLPYSAVAPIGPNEAQPALKLTEPALDFLPIPALFYINDQKKKKLMSTGWPKTIA